MIFNKKEKAVPDFNFNYITEITPEFIKEIGAKAIAVDLDKTAAYFGSLRLAHGVREWTEEMQRAGIAVIVISNTLASRAYLLSKQMGGVPFIAPALKPSTVGINIAAKHLGVEADEIAMIGDKLSTDIMAANRAGSLALRVKPLKRGDIVMRFPSYDAVPNLGTAE